MNLLLRVVQLSLPDRITYWNTVFCLEGVKTRNVSASREHSSGLEPNQKPSVNLSEQVTTTKTSSKNNTGSSHLMWADSWGFSLYLSTTLHPCDPRPQSTNQEGERLKQSSRQRQKFCGVMLQDGCTRAPESKVPGFQRLCQ